jgi:serine/threonine-protein kinase
VHRDVKPGNVLIGRDGRVKVTDFGIARAIAEAQMTLPGTTLGSVHYFSPEQARGEPATAASDIFSLGIVLFEMLTGVRPWEGDSAAGVALARLTGPTPDPALLRPSTPPDLAAIDRKALALDPVDRYSSAGVMADALDAWLNSSAAAAGTGVAGAAAVGGAAAAGVAGAAVVSGTARPNPGAVPYDTDAYATANDAVPGPPLGAAGAAAADADDTGATSPLVWVAGIVAIALLVAVAFLVFQLVSGGPTPTQQVTVPNFVGTLVNDATRQADLLGITLDPTGQESSLPAGTILTQDPPGGTKVDDGSAIKVTVATAPGTVPVPDLKNKPESEAFQAIVTAGLTVGTRTEAFDPTVPAGSVVAQSPGAGIVVAKGTAVDVTVSKGPEPTPSPTPTPTPTPTPSPTPVPTPTPTPVPTPTPTPTPSPLTPTPTPTPTPSPDDGRAQPRRSPGGRCRWIATPA